MLLIYAEKYSSRFRYSIRLIFRELLQCKVELSSDYHQFKEHKGPKLHYHSHRLCEGFFLQSHGLLFENGIVEQELKCFPYESTKALFPVSEKSDFPFDVFAASFYLAVRYEEYLPHKRDPHDRFMAEQSVATQEGFLHQAVVNRWAEKLWLALQKQFPELERKIPAYSMLCSIDIDSAFAIKEKGFVRTTASITNSLLKFDTKGLALKFKVLLGLQKDPYDSYDFQFAMIKKYKVPFIYFFLMGNYGVNDKNVSVHNDRFQSLVRQIADYAKVGIHPSYNSNNDYRSLEKEVGRLAPITKREVQHSRQHFLKLKLPDTYRALIELDIFNDYTMGYVSHYGFRAGLCTPYYFYDLDLEVETRLKIHPFAISDATLKYYLNLDAGAALDHFKKMIDEVRSVNGKFISLWHNDSLCEDGEWKGWAACFEEMIKYGKA